MANTAHDRRLRAALPLSVVVACLATVLALAPLGAEASDERGDEAAAPARDEVRSPQFDDVPPDHPFLSSIDWLAGEGIAAGYGDGTFRPQGTVTRGAVAAFLARYRGIAPAACTEAAFPDVPADNPFCAEIAWLAGEEVASGFTDGTFRPALPVSRQTMAALLYRLAGPKAPALTAECASPFADVPADHPFCVEIAWLAATGIADGFAAADFGPTLPVSRQALAAFLFRLDQHEALPVPSPGCGTSEVGPLLNTQVDLEVNGTDRWYLLTTPVAHDGATPLPLVLDFHGLAEGAVIHTSMSNFSPLAQSEGFVVAFPQGTGSPVRWNTSLAETNPDLVYVDAVLDDLGDDLCLDLSRVYATGLSMGAMMSSTLGCVRSDRFAAAAPVAGILRPTDCDPSRPVPMLSYHGTADTILLFNGGFGTFPGSTTAPTSGPTTTVAPNLNGPGYPANVAAWAAGNGCDPLATDTPETDEVIRRVYDCPRHGDVEFTIVVDGGHAWPGSAFSAAIAAVIGHTTFDADATAEAWAFFQRYHL
jgi:polyhydroxybutyrate depolymerase